MLIPEYRHQPEIYHIDHGPSNRASSSSKVRNEVQAFENVCHFYRIWGSGAKLIVTITSLLSCYFSAPLHRWPANVIILALSSVQVLL